MWTLQSSLPQAITGEVSPKIQLHRGGNQERTENGRQGLLGISRDSPLRHPRRGRSSLGKKEEKKRGQESMWRDQNSSVEAVPLEKKKKP